MKLKDNIKKALSGDKRDLCDLIKKEYPKEVTFLKLKLGELTIKNYWDYLCSLTTFYRTKVKKVGSIKLGTDKYLIQSEYESLGKFKLKKDTLRQRRHYCRGFYREFDFTKLVNIILPKLNKLFDGGFLKIEKIKRKVYLTCKKDTFFKFSTYISTWSCIGYYQTEAQISIPVLEFLKFLNSIDFEVIENPTPVMKLQTIASEQPSDLLQKRLENRELHKSGMTKILVKIAIFILEALEKQKKTKEDIAENTGIPIEIVDSIIRGKHKDVTFFEVKKIFNYLNISIEFNIVQ